MSVLFTDDVAPLMLKFETEEIDEDLGNRPKPRRLAFSNVTAAKSVEMVTVVTPASEALIAKYLAEEQKPE